MEVQMVENTIIEIAFADAGTRKHINDALRFLLTHSRSENGRRELVNAGLLNYLVNYLSYLITNQESGNQVLINDVLRVVRNLCAGNSISQTEFVFTNCLTVIQSFFNQLISQAGAGGILENTETENLLRTAMQLLANLCQDGEDSQSAIWMRFFPEIFTNCAQIENPKLLEPLSLIIYTCCKNNRERLNDLIGLCGCRIFAGILRASQAGDIERNWLELLARNACFQEPCFGVLFENLGLQAQSIECKATDGNVTFTKEQGYLLHLVASFLACQSADARELINSREHKPVLCDFVRSVAGILHNLERCIFSVSSPASSVPTGNPSIDIFAYCLSILKDLFAYEDPFGSDKKIEYFSNDECLVPLDLISFLLDLLRDLGPPDMVKREEERARKACLNRSNKSSPYSESIEDRMAEEAKDSSAKGKPVSLTASGDGTEGGTEKFRGSCKICPYRGFRRDLVSVLANAAFQRKQVQDRIRECNGIFVLLQQCIVDASNPFLKEWGLWALRNLLEDNKENQNEIADLQLQDSVNTQDIKQMGLKIEIDSSTGRPKLVNVGS